MSPESQETVAGGTSGNEVVPDLAATADLECLRHNLRLIHAAVGAGTEIIACVKANAYGHGLVEVAKCLRAEGVLWLSVGSPREALILRREGIGGRVLLFPPVPRWDLQPLVRAGITLGVQSYSEAQAVAGESGEPVSVFLKVDSGFGRMGAPLGEAIGIASKVMRDLPQVDVEGVFTHLPFAEPAQISWVRERLKEFGGIAAAIRDRTRKPLLIQALASTGIVCGLDAPEANAVSPGQLVFGIEPAWAAAVTGRESFGTRAVLTNVSATISSLRVVDAGQRFGSGGRRTAPTRMKLGVLPIGYSNSLLVPREGQVVGVEGRSAPILSVSLEHAVVDLSGIDHVEEGSRAYLIASDPSEGPSLGEVARAQQRSPLEVLVSLTGRVNVQYV